jgi:hypothetical protein
MAGKDDGISPIVRWDQISPVDQTKGFFHPSKASFRGTISDSDLYPEGFFLGLPTAWKITVPKDKRKPILECIQDTADLSLDGDESFSINKIYVPFSELREPWQHQSGLWGISDTTAQINNILLASREIVSGSKGSPGNLCNLLRQYFYSAAKRLSTKKGLISTHCMAARFPSSVKATAAVSDKLPENTVEIHNQMAKDLGVRSGDIVLVERFPCLGFMSLRMQRVLVTDDSNCRYTIRVSGNSLASLNLDFDGDVIFLSSFNTPAAQEELEYHFRFPHPELLKFTKEASDKKKPVFWEADLDDMMSFSLRNNRPPMSFAPLNEHTNAEISAALISLKTSVGSAIALTYNLSRIMEGAIGYEDQKISAQIEKANEIIGNSSFGVKHAVVKLLETMHQKENRKS